MSSALRTLQQKRKTDPCFPGVPRDKHQAGTVLKEVKSTVREGHFLRGGLGGAIYQLLSEPGWGALLWFCVGSD